MSARISKKAPKDVNAPRKPLSSYFLFTRDRRASLKAEQPSLKTTEMAKVLSAEWKALDAAAKDKYTAEASQAKAEYATKLAEYKKTSEFGAFTLRLAEWKRAQSESATATATAKPSGKAFKATKKPKDAKAPKRPQTAYFLFTAARRAAVKEANPDAKVTEIAKLLGAEWKALSAEEKAPFVEKAETAKAAYTAAMATYKGSADFAAHEETVAAWARNEKRGKAEAEGKLPKVSLPRKPKDANRPKRAPTAYFLFTAERRAAVSAANPEAKITQIAKLMGAEWKALSEEEKAPFVEKAEKAKAASAAKMEAYKGSAEEKAFEAQLREWEAECERRRQAAMAKMDRQMAKLEVSKAKAKEAKEAAKEAEAMRKIKSNRKFVDDSDSESDDSDSESMSESSSSGSESSSASRSYSSSSEEDSSYSD